MLDVVLLAELPVALELAVKAAERRALVARDHRAGVQSAAAVGAMLVERQPDEPLQARDQCPALVEHVLVVEGDLPPDALTAPAVAGAAEARAVAGRPATGLAARRNAAVDIIRLSLSLRPGPMGKLTYHSRYTEANASTA